MQLARVKGTVVSTNKAEKLNGLKLQLIKPIDIETWQEKGGLLVAIDAVGAGEGEVVMVVSGSADDGNDPQQDTRRILHPDGIQLSVYSTACSASVRCRMEWEYSKTPDPLAGGGSLELRRIPGTSGVCEPAV